MPTPPFTDAAAVTTARAGDLAVDGHDSITLRFERRGTDTEFEILGARGDEQDPGVITTLAKSIAEAGHLPALVGSSIYLAADHPAEVLHPLPEAVAGALGLIRHRDLLQLRRLLPVPADHPIRTAARPVATRPFRASSDLAAWVRVNNRAFAAHADQGRETVATLEAHLAEPWFDGPGFLVADDDSRPGELSGFCWTKVHSPSAPDPALGEIYVIGVDPSHRGEGLGPAFVLAGLDHLASVGISVGNLYVDADNKPALRLYDRLGFAMHQRRRVYTS